MLGFLAPAAGACAHTVDAAAAPSSSVAAAANFRISVMSSLPRLVGGSA
jgi:hypothetical protein